MDRDIAQRIYELYATLLRENEDLARAIGEGYPNESRLAIDRFQTETEALAKVIEDTIQEADNEARMNGAIFIGELPFYPHTGLLSSVDLKILDSQDVKNTLKLSPFLSSSIAVFVFNFGITTRVTGSLLATQKAAAKKQSYVYQLRNFYETSKNTISYNDAFCMAFIHQAHKKTLEKPESIVFSKLLKTAEFVCDLWIAQGQTKMKRG